MSHDFTIERYREVLGSASERFDFIRFGADTSREKVALWRHDIDFSPQRALGLARIEAEMGLAATYFVQLSSRFYSAFEPGIATILRQIVAMGHDVGLHFDAEVCRHHHQPDYQRRLAFEARVLEEITEAPVSAFSLHNPTTMAGDSLDEKEYAGLFNASSSSMRNEFAYCSDSNGLWRYRSLDDMVSDTAIRRLYVLTHPEWWQEIATPPRQRIQRSIDGRAAYCSRYYDELLAENERPNVGAVG